MEYSSGVALSPGVLFENSIVCLVVFVCLFWLPVWGTPRLPVSWVACFFDASCFGVFLLGQACSDSNSLLSLDGLFLFGEFDSGSGERWRRA